MVRQRRPQATLDTNKINKGTNSSSSNGSNTPNTRFSKKNVFNCWKQVMVFTVLGIAIYFGYLGYLETRVNTPFDDKKDSCDYMSKLEYVNGVDPYTLSKSELNASLDKLPKVSKNSMNYLLSRTSPATNAEIRAYRSLDTDVRFACKWIESLAAKKVGENFIVGKVVVQNGLDVPEKFWGTYRPGVYFGLKTREPNSIVTGLMWYFPKRLKPGGDGIRHWCEQGDNLEKYGWLKHDGNNFGIQEIVDGPFKLTTSFVKRPGGSRGGEWSARISVDPTQKDGMKDEDVSLIWYTALDEETKGFIEPTNSGTKLTGIRGQTSTLGEFTLKFSNQSGILLHESFLSTLAPGLHVLKETIISSLRLAQDRPNLPKKIILAGELLPVTGTKKDNPNFVAIQLTGKLPFIVDVVFESASYSNKQETLVGEAYTKALIWHETQFNEKFEATFNLTNKGYKNKEIKFAQATLSNMVGGIGYFYGSSKVQSVYTKEPVPYWRAPLYTGVPSRSFFPRGFLWDEGFHGLLISQWDLDIELDIISHWFDLMNVEGWIPREQILGIEALAKVPEEFVVQWNTNANPPTFFLTLQDILNRYSKDITKERRSLLQRLYPRLQAWFAWFNTTQKGALSGSYRWRGRDAFTNRELNPKTLTSGLDDYPRSSHPNEKERHIDLYCWIALAADTMAKLASVLGKDGYKYDRTARYLMDNDLMDELHWSEFAEIYADYGLHTDSVKLERPKPLPRSQNQNLEMYRTVLKKPEYRLVDSTFGYVSLFPFLLQIIKPDSAKLEKILIDLQKPELLWTKYGLRSLSKSAPLYMKRNTEHDPPYWRGQIWINMNFLATRALHFYSNAEGPYKELAIRVYKNLRENIINNVINQYYRSNYMWEQYNDRTGEGSGCRPFTGWTALTVVLMAETY